jgi:hypothetical protein
MTAIAQPLVAAPPARTTLARWLLLEALLLGTLADSVLRTTSLGAGWFLWTLGLVLTVALLAKRFGVGVTAEQRLWLVLALASAVMLSWRDAEMLRLGNVAATLVALAMFSMSTGAGISQSAFVARLRDILRAQFVAVGHTVAGAAILWSKDAAVPDATRSAASDRLPVLRGAVITIPVVLILGKLLSAADPVFGRLFQLPQFEVDEAIGHIVFTGLATWACAGWMRGVFIAEPAGPVESRPSTFGTTEVTMVLGAVNVLFGVFMAMQVRWLFGGAAVVQATTGLSVAEYARSGFFELVAVAGLVLPLLLGSRALVEHNTSAVERHRKLALPMLALVGGIILSAVSRMMLYVSSYGLTTDRLYALVVITWLALVFAGMAVSVLRDRGRAFAAFSILSAFALLTALNVANPEAIVARYELTRTSRVSPIDWRYLARLSGDAAPLVASALVAAEPGEAQCKALHTLAERNAREKPFQISSFNAGASRGQAVVLAEVTPHSLRRLCAASLPTSPSVSLSR